MQFTEIVSPTIKELFVRRIEDSILNGELAVGDRLPSERELAEQMKISKTAVHSGVCDMVRKGFLEVVPRKGIFVGDYAKNGTLETLESIMQYSGGRLDKRNVQSMLEMRYAIESVALVKLIEAKDAATIENLHCMFTDAEKELMAGEPDYRKVGEFCFQFHHYICVASGNTIAPMIFNAFKKPSVSFWTNSSRALGRKEALRRVKVFLDLILAGNAETAQMHLQYITETSTEIVREQ